MKKECALIVLAAGRGSRFGGLKQFVPIGPQGEKLLEYNLYDALQAGFSKVVLVVRKALSSAAADFFQGLAERVSITFAYQEIEALPAGDWQVATREKPWGTGHALWVSREVIDSPFGLINADDFYGREALQTLAEQLRGGATPGALVTYPVERTLSKFGAVSRGVCTVEGGYLTDIVERKEVRENQGEISYLSPRGRVSMPRATPISMNLWGGTPAILDKASQYFEDFLRENAGDKNAEFYLSTIYKRALSEEGMKVSALESHSEWFGLTYAEDADHAKQRIATLIKTGRYPEQLWG